MADRVRARIVVSGRVQGVAFRQSAADEGRRLGVKGWVRNLPDGRVEAEVEGERAAVGALVRWCHAGPPAARVDGVEVEWVDPAGDLGAFEIRF